MRVFLHYEECCDCGHEEIELEDTDPGYGHEVDLPDGLVNRWKQAHYALTDAELELYEHFGVKNASELHITLRDRDRPVETPPELQRYAEALRLDVEHTLPLLGYLVKQKVVGQPQEG